MTYYQPYDRLYQGEDKTLVVKLYDGNGVPLTGFGAYTFIYRVVAVKGSRSAIIEKTVGSGIVLDVANNEIEIAFAKADTQNLDALEYWHELRADDGLKEDVSFEGEFTLQPSSTL